MKLKIAVNLRKREDNSFSAFFLTNKNLFEILRKMKKIEEGTLEQEL